MTSIPSLPPRPSTGAANAATAGSTTDQQTSPTSASADQRTVGQAEILLLVHNATVTMYPFTSPTNSSSSTTPSDLLAHVAATQGSLRARGTLECYSLELHPPTPTDSTLGLTMLSVPGAGAYSTGNADEDTFQLPLTSDLNVVRAGTDSDAFLVPVPSAGCVFRISVASPDPAEGQALADLLGHYTALNEPSPTYRNTVALVGPSGQVVGTLADSVHLDTHLVNPDAKGPVVVAQVPAVTPDAPIQWTVAELPAVGAAAAATTAGDASFESKLVSTSEMLGDWMIQGAGIVSSGIMRGSVAVKNAGWVTPNATPMVLTPVAKGNIETAKSVSEVAVKATGAILSGAVTVAAAVGSAVAGKLQSDGRGGVVPANSTRARTVKLTSALIRSLAVLGDRASTAGRTVLKATGQGAAELIEYKYGSEAGQAAREVTSVAENMWIVYFDSRGFKRMVLLTGAKSTVHELAGKDKTLTTATSTTITTSTKSTAAGTPAFTSTSQTTATSTVTTGPAPAGTDPAQLASQAMTYAATTAPKVAAAVQQHAPKVAAAVIEHGPKVAAAVASGAWALWSKVGEQLAQAQAAQAQQQQAAGVAVAPAAAPGVPPRPTSAAAPGAPATKQ